ncbi:desulfoferrodoxin [Clostridium luticellarii]|jgi:superoxide reductase|uniref:Desulfoferrodoxin n=1 Tax=Clostridium luticellarii TaxID=1691940 RepID=A0A2T0BND9_9CLOT|nr:desulfoferrodoxin [Clostridium luticellarii]MCI1945449.1 desulfoferrodoxin [Clostridium luticellarii]MCI1968782.1 desulfoferrodoxin [Clostridium luticellarii]MCI1994944.1 desulfoferrodoxin [Clostridium luticellarii]MCI2040209.1 desulfoferrodoxin [Clostridium luticellarii]PRR85373.1 Desulfoferrodoxin [Clostridium luticellarii]
MIEVKQVYKCEICGNIVEVLYKGGGTLVCCGKPMKLIEENTVDAALEKHVPVIEEIPGGVKVKVGSVEHPMLPEHYIQWIEVHTENKIYRKYLKPGEKPEATFKVDEKVIAAREYCNLHGLWKK